jgi:hypothetical protein
MSFSKNVIIFFFVFQILFPNDLKNDLASLPFLFQHFAHHNQHEGSKKMGFIDFLIKHYSDDHHRDEDPKNHEHLPFQNYHVDSNFYQVIAPDFEPKTFLFLNQYFQMNKTIQTVFIQEYFPSRILLSIWKPPQFFN